MAIVVPPRFDDGWVHTVRQYAWTSGSSQLLLNRRDRSAAGILVGLDRKAMAFTFWAHRIPLRLSEA